MVNGSSVEAILASIGERSLSPPRPVSGGWSGTSIWRVELATGERSLRVFAPDEAAVARRESKIMLHARSAGIPAPRVYACDVADGKPFTLLDWIEGRALDDELLHRSWRAVRLGEQFGALQARLHRVAAPEGLAAAIGWAGPNAVPDELRARLERSDVRRDCLVHLDFHPKNVIVEDGRIVALIDWTNARAGDPRFDVARTYVILRLLVGVPPVLRMAGRPIADGFARGWRRTYKAEIGPLAELPVFLAWAGYTMIADMRVKPEYTEDSGAGRDLRARLRVLDRRVDHWMRLAGIECG